MARWSFFIVGQIFFFQPEERADRIDTKFGTFLECTYSHARSEGLLLLFVSAPSLGLGVHKNSWRSFRQGFLFFPFALVKKQAKGPHRMTTVSVLNLGGEDALATVSPGDFTVVTSHHWILKNGYAVTRRSNRYVSMHRLVMGQPPRGQSIDHVDRNRLNNTRKNLRFATAVSQARNRGSSRRKHLGLAGVVGVQPTKSGAFAARFRRKHLGTFRTIEEAAHAYDEAARQYDDAHGVEHGN